jgi:Asp-tRNA(Asn)/Glu-tRNA(Gln) amidotransferase C subunit
MGAEKDQGLAQVIEQLGQQLQMIAAWMQKATEVQTAGVGQMTERMDAIGKAVTAKRVLRRDKAGRAVSSEIEMP